MPPAAPPLPPGRHLDLPGRGRTFVRDLEGPPGAPAVILLHGLAATADLNWFTSYETLGRHFRVVAIDHRGHGRGIRSRRRFRLADCADDAAAVCEALGIDRVVAAGYSMGGPIAQLLWHRHRDLVAGLVLCATGRNFRGDARERLVYRSLPIVSGTARLVPPGVWRRLGEQVFNRRLADGPLGEWAASELRRTDPVAVVEAGTALARFSSHEWIGDVDVPTVVVVTTRDTLVPPSRQLKLAHAIPHSVVLRVDGDHGACVLAPHRFVPTLVEACRRAWSGAVV